MKNKTVVITGASSGIGREAAFLFAKEGARLVLTYFKNREGGESTAAECRRLGAADVLLAHVDLRDDTTIGSLIEGTAKRFGTIDVLINNAGYLVEKNIRDQTFEDIENQIRTNLEGLIKLTSAALPHVTEMVINVASGAGKSAYAGYGAYSATKFGVRGFTQAVMLEEPKLTIVSVNPGLTATPMTDFEGEPPQHVAAVILKTAKGEIEPDAKGDVDVWKY
jgi:NAD(P)-dependent dehydrogenase (short-subunit alcohol dehydrogenase family)